MTPENPAPVPEMHPGQGEAPPDPGPSLLLHDGFYYGLGRRLWVSVHDRWFLRTLPPLRLTSRPLDIGMLPGDVLGLPWYRTIFTNLGDVITPETLPPLQLESRPVDVELIGDMTARGWWTSLVRNLADAIAPERMPPLQLTSSPVNPEMMSEMLDIPRWSTLITGPKMYPGKAEPLYLPPRPRPHRPAPAVQTAPPQVSSLADVHTKKLKKRLTLSRLREAALISVAALEVAYLVASHFGLF